MLSKYFNGGEVNGGGGGRVPQNNNEIQIPDKKKPRNKSRGLWVWGDKLTKLPDSWSSAAGWTVVTFRAIIIIFAPEVEFLSLHVAVSCWSEQR